MTDPIYAGGPTYSEVIGHAFAESYFLMRDAAEAAFDDNLAVADAEYARTPSLTQAARAVYTAPVLSRGHAASLLIGVSPDISGEAASALPGLGSEPLFATERTNDSAFKTAVAIFRDAAPAPADIVGPENTDTLVASRGTLTEGSVAERLEEFYAATLPSSFEEIADFFGTTTAALKSARQYLVEEIRGYDRDFNATLPAYDLVSGPATFSRYAATATAPHSQSGHWSSLALGREGDGPIANRIGETSFGGSSGPTFDYVRRSVAGAIDYALSYASELLEHSGDLTDETMGGFASLISDLGERPLRVEYNHEDESTLVLRILGVSKERSMVVRGTAGLECATQGTVEGQPCDLDDFNVIADAGSDILLSGWEGFDHGTEVIIDPTVVPDTPGESETFFVVPMSDDVLIAGSGHAGNYDDSAAVPVHIKFEEDLGGAFIPLGGSIPANPWAAERVRRALEPSDGEDGDHTKAANHCAGIDIDTQLIPLENELSEDGSGHENSWRTYLTLARQAADEADRLGQDLIEQGLRMDQRAEGALDILAEQCGSSIDIDWSRVSLDTDGDGQPDLHDGPCPCSPGYVCHAGHCVADPVTGLLDSHPNTDDANLSRLRKCLSESERIPFASLGDQVLCVWRNPANPSSVCSGYAHDCPFLLNDAKAKDSSVSTCEGIAESFIGANPGSVGFVSVKPLDLFEYNDRIPDIDETDRGELCRNIRQLSRSSITGETRKAIFDAVRADSAFRIAEMSTWAGGLSGSYRPGGFVELRRGRKTWHIATGDLENGPRTGEWPCIGVDSVPPPPLGDECANSGDYGFFCQPAVDCGDYAQRRSITDRTLAAVLTARAISGLSLSGNTFAFRHRGDDDYFDLSGGSSDSGSWANRYDDNGAFFMSGEWPDLTNDRIHTGHMHVSVSSTPVIGERVQATRIGRHPEDTTLWEGGTSPLYLGRYDKYSLQYTDLTYRQAMAQAMMSGFHATGGHTSSYLYPFYTDERKPDIVYIDKVIKDPDPSDTSVVQWAESREPERAYNFHTGNWYTVTTTASYIRRDPLMLGASFHLPVASPPKTITTQNVYDALELICESPNDNGDVFASCGSPGGVSGINDLPRLSSYLNCAADVFERQGSLMTFANLPRDVSSALIHPEPFGAFPANGGEYAAAISALRFNLRQLPVLRRNVSQQIIQFSEMIAALEARLRNIGLSDELTEIQLASTVAHNISSCASAAVRAASVGIISGAGGAAAVACANAAVQVIWAFEEAAVRAAMGSNEKQALISDFMQNFHAAAEAIESAADALSRAQEQIEGNVILIENVRGASSRAVSRALFADSDASGAVYPVNTVMRRQLSIAKARYITAREYAIRMAALARLAVEQRIGSPLEDLGELSLVESPSSWAESLCTATGINYDNIRDFGSVQESFEDEYVGDYVDKLEAVVESYRLDYPFSDGSDQAVLSLRDEVFRVTSRGTCSEGEPSRNLLSESTDLRTTDSWSVYDCEFITAADGSPVIDDCVSLRDLGEDPAGVPVAKSLAAASYRLVFGNYSEATNAGAGGQTIDPATMSLRNTTSVATSVDTLSGHWYRVSYYARIADVGFSPPGPAPQSLVTIEDSEGTPLQGQFAADAGADGWSRYWALFQGVYGEDLKVVLRPVAGASYPQSQLIDIAEFMVEDVTAEIQETQPDPLAYPPTPFEHSSQQYAFCEDTTGEVFRHKHWSRSCERFCPTGQPLCSSSSRVSRCFWDLTFSLRSPADLGSDSLVASSLSRGSYNYRVDEVGVNFVGTNIRDCSEAPLGSRCYANGSIPYSLYQDSGFEVINHRGQSFAPPLYPGRVEGGRGLAAERYLTNPLSSADGALVGPYLARGMQGRPLAGSYRLRVWEDAGVDVSRIEDVQLLINYRYWTRLD